MPFTRRLTEHQVEGKRLGRHVHHDERSRNFPAETATQIKSVTHNATGLPLNQGDIGSCTANALCGALNSTPDYKDGHVYIEQDAIKLYELETQLEGEPYPPNDPGGSGLMVCRAAKQLGWIRSYRHAFGLEHALKALVLRPVIFGVNWYSQFDQPNRNGLVSYGGSIRGGHEIVADELDAENELVWFWNSWGLEYGIGGRFCMTFGTLDQLLQEYGDATVPYP